MVEFLDLAIEFLGSRGRLLRVGYVLLRHDAHLPYRAIGQMGIVTQQNVANAEESASAAEELNSQVEELNHAVRQLRALVEGTEAGTELRQGRRFAERDIPFHE